MAELGMMSVNEQVKVVVPPGVWRPVQLWDHPEAPVIGKVAEYVDPEGILKPFPFHAKPARPGSPIRSSESLQGAINHLRVEWFRGR